MTRDYNNNPDLLTMVKQSQNKPNQTQFQMAGFRIDKIEEQGFRAYNGSTCSPFA
jgi:hypothetical protein